MSLLSNDQVLFFKNLKIFSVKTLL